MHRDRAEADDDFARSLMYAYEVIRDRIRMGGEGWTPKASGDGRDVAVGKEKRDGPEAVPVEDNQAAL